MSGSSEDLEDLSLEIHPITIENVVAYHAFMQAAAKRGEVSIGNDFSPEEAMQDIRSLSPP